MLQRLYIRDYALIDEMTINFLPGLNILTGETGAGKSIIIGAFSLILGERVKSSVIRKGAETALVEGLFTLTPPLSALVKSHGVEADELLLLRREVYQGGRSRAFANDSPINAGVLASIGDALIDLHGQHDHQALLKTATHISTLDQYGIDPSLLDRMRQIYRHTMKLTEELQSRREKEQLLSEKEELLSFQVQQISQVNPEEGEDESLAREEKLLNSSERLIKDAASIMDLLYEGEGSVSERMSAAENLMAVFSNIDVKFKDWAAECNTLRISVEELVKGLQSYVSNIKFDPGRLEAIRERLGQLSLLKKKYGGSLGEVLTFYRRASQELQQIGSMEEEIKQLKDQIESEKERLSSVSNELSVLRREAARRLESDIIAAMQELGLKNGLFEIRIDRKEDAEGTVTLDNVSYAAGPLGIDHVAFHIALNPGEDLKPLKEVASGGEISRIMLAIKTVLANTDNVPILVFDEIDSGISGRVAWVVGERLRDVAANHQVICITHLPQIASRGACHFSVEKQLKENRSVTTIRPLTEDERITEIAKLIGGETISETSLQSARELLES